MAKLHVIQDGRDFYAAAGLRGPIWSASFTVRDGDMQAAQRARQEFLARAERAGWEIEFEGESD